MTSAQAAHKTGRLQLAGTSRHAKASSPSQLGLVIYWHGLSLSRIRRGNYISHVLARLVSPCGKASWHRRQGFPWEVSNVWPKLRVCTQFSSETAGVLVRMSPSMCQPFLAAFLPASEKQHLGTLIARTCQTKPLALQRPRKHAAGLGIPSPACCKRPFTLQASRSKGPGASLVNCYAGRPSLSNPLAPI